MSSDENRKLLLRYFIRDEFTSRLLKTCNMKSRVCRGGSSDLYKLLISSPATPQYMKTDPEHLQIVSGMGHTYIRYNDTEANPPRYIYIDPTIAQFNATFEGIFVGTIQDLQAIANRQKNMKGYKLNLGDYLGSNYKDKGYPLPPLIIEKQMMISAQKGASRRTRRNSKLNKHSKSNRNKSIKRSNKTQRGGSSKEKPIVYYIVSDNFGDGINPLIFNHFMKSPPVYKHLWEAPPKPTAPFILGIGSLLSLRMDVDASQQIVCGSGFIEKDKIPQKPLRIISVRGPMTRQKFLDAHIPCPERYGDMALLIRYIIKPPTNALVTKRFKYGIIPHYVDKDHPYIKQIRARPECTIIDINQAKTPEKFVKELHECTYILSSTLHGIIICDSYGIPAHHISLTDKVVGGTWKFRDYYASVGRQYNSIDIKTPYETLESTLPKYTVFFDFDNYYNYMKKALGSL